MKLLLNFFRIVETMGRDDEASDEVDEDEKFVVDDEDVLAIDVVETRMSALEAKFWLFSFFDFLFSSLISRFVKARIIFKSVSSFGDEETSGEGDEFMLTRWAWEYGCLGFLYN